MRVSISQEELKDVLDQVIREVTEKVAGIRIYEGEVSPGEDLWTVYATCEGGLHFTLSLCSEAYVFTRLTRHIMQEKNVTGQNVEEFTKDYFSVLCGNIAARLFQITRVASHFGAPVFSRGCARPKGGQRDFVLSYFSEQNECAQMTCYTFPAE